jgi:hypothetical protein
LDPGRSFGLPGGAREHCLPVELQRDRTSAYPGRSARALSGGRRPGLAGAPVRWGPPVDEPWIDYGENSAGAAVNPVEAMLDSLERVGGGPKQSGVASLPEACR